MIGLTISCIFATTLRIHSSYFENTLYNIIRIDIKTKWGPVQPSNNGENQDHLMLKAWSFWFFYLNFNIVYSIAFLTFMIKILNPKHLQLWVVKVWPKPYKILIVEEYNFYRIGHRIWLFTIIPCFVVISKHSTRHSYQDQHSNQIFNWSWFIV